MKKRFPGNYKLTDAEFAELWENCIFVPDTNILLHLFRYGEKTWSQVVETLDRLKPRVWIPYRVGFEFQRRWRDVDQSNRDAYDSLSREIEGLGRKLEAVFESYTRHQTIDVKNEQQLIKTFITETCARLASNKEKHPPAKDAENLFMRISDLIGDAVGEKPSDSEYSELIKQGEIRYAKETPPGYRDAKEKSGDDRYGDYFIWKEILEYSKINSKPIILVTDDAKDDWWQEFRGAKIGPRPELVEELQRYAGQRFYLYRLSQFLDYASVFLKRSVDTSAIEEIKSDEQQQREVARRASHEHVYPWNFSKRLIDGLTDEQRDAHRRRRQIDTEILAIGRPANSEEIERIQQLLEERRDITSSILRRSRQIRDLRTHPNISRLSPAENTQKAIGLLQRLLFNDENGSPADEPKNSSNAADDE